MSVITIPADRVTAFQNYYNARVAGGLTADQALQAAVQQLSNDTGWDPVTIQQSLIAQGVTQAGTVDVT